MTEPRRPAGVILGLMAAISCLAAGAAAQAAAGAPFYEGKTLRIIVGSGPGSGYDAYSRLLAQVLPNHIPGHPAIVVQNMVGASGLLSAQHMYNVAPRDGTVIASAVSTTPTSPLLNPDGAKFDSNRFSWLGSITKDVYTAFVWHTAPIKTYEDAKRTESVMGGTSGSASIDLAIASNKLFGTKFKVVSGYNDTTDVKLAMERGEVHGTFGNLYSSLKVAQADWIKEGKIRLILQHGFQKHPDLADVPLFIDQAKSQADRQILELMLAPQEYAKAYYTPPDVPPELVEILRRGFEATVKDPAFAALATKSHVEFRDPMSGEELAATIKRLTATPPAVVARIGEMLAEYKK